jgi:D-beta-D-heptose 7-phosphate kinase/D-beta-D-heptose 1-phosphate adenosyltransferase
VACSKRASRERLLFDDVLPAGKELPIAQDRCLDTVCYQEKAMRAVDRNLQELAAKHGRALPVITDTCPTAADLAVARAKHSGAVQLGYDGGWQETSKSTKELIEKENIDVVILSDYGKGVFSKTDTNVSQEIIQFCRERNVTTIVDPKTLDYEYWQGCDIFKPNSQYVKNFVEKFYSMPIVGDSSLEWERRSIIIQERIKCKNLLITDSGNGIHVKDQEKYRHYGSQELSFTRPVIRSVIGAGDCFCSFLALAISEGFDLFTSSRLAFNAASCYIQDKHNNPITKHQLRSWFDPHAAKIVSLDDLLEIQADNPNEVFVMTNGCFDCGLTNGHIECLQFAKNRGTKLVVAMNSDDSVQRLKGPERPIMPLKHRMNIMAAVSFVDFIVAFDEDTPIKVVEKLRPKYIVKGGDYKQEDVAGYGISDIVIFPLVESISTTEKIKKLELNTV